MFSFIKERLISLILPLIMIIFILIQGWQANHWRAEAQKEEQLKIQWSEQFRDLAQSVKRFDQAQQTLSLKIDNLSQTQQQQSKELHDALHRYQNWSNSPVPDDIRGLFNGRALPPQNAPIMPTGEQVPGVEPKDKN